MLKNHNLETKEVKLRIKMISERFNYSPIKHLQLIDLKKLIKLSFEIIKNCKNRPIEFIFFRFLNNRSALFTKRFFKNV